jgi:hypothetical protein
MTLRRIKTVLAWTAVLMLGGFLALGCIAAAGSDFYGIFLNSNRNVGIVAGIHFRVAVAAIVCADVLDALTI